MKLSVFHVNWSLMFIRNFIYMCVCVCILRWVDKESEALEERGPGPLRRRKESEALKKRTNDFFYISLS